MSGVSDGKPHLGIVICGHVDAGKSTTTGHLLFKLGGIKEREMEKLKEEARAQNMESFAFAFYIIFAFVYVLLFCFVFILIFSSFIVCSFRFSSPFSF